METIQAPAAFPVVIGKSAPCYAARELAAYLQKRDGTRHPIVPAAEGFCLRLEWDAPGLLGEAFRIAISEKGISLQAGTLRGAVYGVYALLERLGCRFFAPDCEVIPQGPIHLPLGQWTESPAFDGRELFWREAMDGAFAVKLRLNSARSSITPEQGGKLGFFNFSHTFHQLVPVERYFDAHPEYFSCWEGKRRRERTQLCLTNPEVLRLCVEGVKKWARENPDRDIFSVAMNDWYHNCQCPACAAVDREEGGGAGTMIRFVNAVAEAVEQEFPRVRIHTFAYLYCRKPPLHTRPRKNVLVRLCSIECCFSHPIDRCGCETAGIDVQYGSARPFRGDPEGESSFLRDLAGWSRICENLYIWDYTTNYANYLQPFPNLRVLAENLRLFQRMGVRGVFEQGNFSLGRCGALGQLKIYLLARLLWDPAQEPQPLIDEFVRGYYGPAATPMAEYVRLWEDAAGASHACIYDPPDAPYLTDGVLSRAERLLEAALRLAGGSYRERVERESLSVRYVRLAQEGPQAACHGERVNDFARDVRRLQITELFERKELEGSIEALRHSRLAADRSAIAAISYPI